MNKLFTALLATATVACFATTANAAIDLSGQPYAGVKIGAMDIDATNAPSLTSYGVYAGYDMANGFGVEADFTGTQEKALKSSENIDVSAKNYGLYGTYKYNLDAMPVYIKGKLGAAKTEVTLKSTLTSDKYKESETTVAGGIGAGYNFTDNISAEVMYNKVHGDVNNYTAGVHFKF